MFVHEWKNKNYVSYKFLFWIVGNEKFMIVVSIVCWIIWKLRNDIIFNDKSNITTINLIILIQSLLNYWTDLYKGEVKKLIKRWLPSDMDMIPLQMMAPVPVITWLWIDTVSWMLYSCFEVGSHVVVVINALG
jgi:hypothetical protein